MVMRITFGCVNPKTGLALYLPACTFTEMTVNSYFDSSFGTVELSPAGK